MVFHLFDGSGNYLGAERQHRLRGGALPKRRTAREATGLEGAVGVIGDELPPGTPHAAVKLKNRKVVIDKDAKTKEGRRVEASRVRNTAAQVDALTLVVLESVKPADLSPLGKAFLLELKKLKLSVEGVPDLAELVKARSV